MPPPVTLTLSDDHGNSESVVLHGPGGKARIAVGEPGRHSGVWEIWSPRTKNDVYIANKNIAGTQKWSLHESGDWRYQWISRLDAWRYAQTDDRLIESWSPPPELGPTGWTSAFVIRVRHQDIVPIPGVSVPADVELIREPHENRAVAVFVVIARPDQGMLNLKGAVPLGGFTLMDGRAATGRELSRFDRRTEPDTRQSTRKGT